MSDWIVIATGQSLTTDDVDYVRGKAKAVAVSDAYKLAPWAYALISQDRAWWEANPEALDFSGDKFCKFELRKVYAYTPAGMPQGCNSGLAGMCLARDYGASRIILLGFDMHGTHYFGPHTKGLKNTTENRFEQMKKQFARFSGCKVVNCTPGTALDVFPKANLRDVL